MVAHRDDALLAPLAAHLHLLAHEIEVTAAESLQLRESHPRAVEELEDREIAHVDEVSLEGARFRELEEQVDLHAVEIAGKMLRLPRRTDRTRRVRLHHLVAVHPAIEAPHAGQRARHGALPDPAP